MFTTHTESTANFWNASLEQIKEYESAFRKAINKEVKEFKPDVIHGQHNWIQLLLQQKLEYQQLLQFMELI